MIRSRPRRLFTPPLQDRVTSLLLRLIHGGPSSDICRVLYFISSPLPSDDIDGVFIFLRLLWVLLETFRF